MSFREPLFLLALAALPLLALAYLRSERRGRSGREAFVPAALLPSVAPVRAGWRRHVAVVAAGLALAVLILALARPQTTVAVDVDQATIVVVTDRSGSMLAEDVRIGAVAFNQTAHVLQSPTREHAAVKEALAGVEAAGSTATGEAIHSGLALIRAARAGDRSRRPAPAAIVLLSDGKSVRGRDPLAAASAAEQERVPIYTVALGTDQGTIETR